MVVDYNSCNYEESLVLKLEAASRDFLIITSEEDAEYRKLLVENTEALNLELFNYMRLKQDLSTSATIGENTKRKIREIYIPPSMYTQFDSSSILTAKDLISFVSTNQTFLRDTLPNQNIKTLTNQNSVMEALSELDPINFRTFESEYPSIGIRIRSGSISSAETNALIKEYNLDPIIFASQVKTKRKNIFDLLNKFLSKLGIGIGIMGSFCAIVEDVFALSKGQRDLTGNSAQFLGNFSNVLGLINPKAGEVIGNVQELVSLMQTSQQASSDVASNLQSAFSTLSGALGIVMQFANVLQSAQGNTTQPTGIEVSWNFPAIGVAILAINPKFGTVIPTTGKPLGDINQDGLFDVADSTAFNTYVANTAVAQVTSYINQTMVPYMNANAASFSEFSNIPSASQPGSSMSNVLGNLSTVAGFIGAGPGSGDFGLSKIIQTISIATGIISSIQSLVSGSKPVSIQNLFSQLDQISQLGQQATEGMFNDFNKTAQDYKKTVEDTLKEAESLAVDSKPRAAEISTKNQASLKDNVSKALEVSGENSKNLGPKLLEIVNKVRGGIRQLAAVGVLDNLNQQLSSVVDQSAADLKSRISLFSPTSVGNGFNLNMISSFGKLAGMISEASSAASDQTTEAMKKSVTGMIAQSSEKFRQKNKEEVEFVALRFCKLAGEIERMYNEVLAPIEQMTAGFAATNAALSAAGNPVTLRAIQAGALRLDTQARIAAMQQAGTISANQSSPFVTAAGVRTNIPPTGTYPIDTVPPLPGDYEFPTYEAALRGERGVLYAPGECSSLSGPAGFIAKSAKGGVDTDAMSRLYLLAARWNQTIKINSAYRSPAANECADGATQSYHMTGKAFDCSVAGRSSQVQFMNLAYLEGFRGFGCYRTFTHIDTRGAPYSWIDPKNLNFPGAFVYYDLPGPPGAKIG